MAAQKGNTKQKIIQSSIKIFAEKGKHGATMEEIAKQANVNKAMVYYYFSSKENLFSEVLLFVIYNIYTKIESEIEEVERQDGSTIKKLKKFIEIHFKVFSANKDYTEIILRALTNDPAETKKTLSNVLSEIQDHFQKIHRLIDESIAGGYMRKIDFHQLVVNVLGMNLTYYMLTPMMGLFFPMDVKEEKEFIDGRLQSITDLVLHGILNKP